MFYNKIFIVVCILIFNACSQKPELPSKSITLNSEVKKSIQIPSSSKQKNLKEEGVFLYDNKIYVKTDGRSVLSILDDLAFKQRFNYTILTQLPDVRLKIFDENSDDNEWKKTKGHFFSSNRELFDFLEDIMNFNCQNCGYKISINNDGIIVSNTLSKIEYLNSYKKIFLFNSDVHEAIININNFFGVKENENKFYSLVSIKSQNALLIKANKDILSQVTEVITSIDSSFPQVMIESQVFEYDDSVSRKIGTALEYGRNTTDYNYGIKTVFGEGVSSLLPSFFNSLNDQAKKQTLLFNIAAQDRNGGVKIIAEPRVVLKPGNKGTIDLATSKYVIASGVNTSELIEIKTGVNLEITPTILSENTIELDIVLTQSEFIPTNEPDIVQSVNRNTINTSLVVYDGELVSIGGIYLQKDSEFNSGIPFLKDIPILGFAFGSSSKDNSRVMIEFMIKPTIKELKQELTKKTNDALHLQNNYAKEQ